MSSSTQIKELLQIEDSTPTVVDKGDPDEERTEWRYKNKLHRLFGPAVVWKNGRMEWHQDGELNRQDGPAVIDSESGDEYWIDGEHISEEEFIQWFDVD
jgi:hypothetical protein